MNQCKLTYDQLLEKVNELEKKLTVNAEASFHRTLLNTHHLFVYVIGKEGRIVFINTFAAKLLEASQEKLIGSNCYDYMPSEIAELRRAQNIKVFESGEPLYYKYKFRDKYLSTSVFRIIDETTNEFCLSILATDITDIFSIEDALKDSEQRFRSIFNNIVEGIVLINETGIFICFI